MRPTSRFLAPQLCLWKLRPTACSPRCYQARQAKGSVEAEKAAAEKAKEGKRAPTHHTSAGVRPYGRTACARPLCPCGDTGTRDQVLAACARAAAAAPVVQL